jgi:membrane protease YdiL (CAAX protease family)
MVDAFARIRTPQEAFLTNGAEDPNQSTPPILTNAPVAPAAIPRPTTTKTVLTWVGVSFVIPTIFIILLHKKLEPNLAVITLAGEIPAKLISAFAVIIGTWLAARMDKKSLADYGVPPQSAFGARFWEGCVWGFAMLSAVVLCIRLTGHFEINSVALAGGDIVKYAIGWAIAFWGVAISEEFIFRGYLLWLYTRRMTFWQGSLILSALFGAAHLGNPNENAFGILQVVVVGMIFCLIIRRTGTLWLAVGFHAAWDWAQTFFYGTADSGLTGQGHLLNTSSEGPKWITGGGAGPEGSVIAFAALLLFALLVHLRFPKALYLTGKEQQAAQAAQLAA